MPDPLAQLATLRDQRAQLAAQLAQLDRQRDKLLARLAPTHRPALLIAAAGVSRSHFYRVTGSGQA